MFDRCPSPEALAEWVAGTPAPRVERHVGKCAACAALASEFRQNDAWLDGLRDAVEKGCDEASRRRVRDVCRQVERSDPPVR